MSTASHAQTAPVFIAPVEILREIFSHCDQPTLAAVSRVSFGCLELTSRFLYTDVVLRKDKASIVSLFRLWFPLSLVPQSARVSVYTSLSRIHSITVEVQDPSFDTDNWYSHIDWNAGDPESLDEDDDWHARYQPGLPIAIFVLSLPAATAPQAPHRHNLHMLINLVDPEIFVARARGPTAASLPSPGTLASVELSAGMGFGSDDWSRLTLAVAQSVAVDPFEVHSTGNSWSPEIHCRVVHDLSPIQDHQFETEDASHPIVARNFVEHNSEINWRRWFRARNRALVATERARALLTDQIHRNDPDVGPGLGLDGPTSIEVVSSRYLALREEIQKGVHKGMDWAALDEM